MKKLILIIFCITLSSCSILPRLSFDTPNTVPQSEVKSYSKDICKGETKFNEAGDIIYCSQGYYANSKNYNKEERKYTFKERVINFFRNLTGSLFWIILLLLIFAPGVIGWVIGNIFNGSRRALESTVRALNKAKRDKDDPYKVLKSEHDKNSSIKREINKLRAKL